MIGNRHGNRFGEMYLSLPDEPVKKLGDVQDLKREIELSSIEPEK